LNRLQWVDWLELEDTMIKFAWASLSLFVLAGIGCAAQDETVDTELGTAHQAISNGQRVMISQFPGTVALRYGGATDPTCSGTLVRSDWVLTAAHCLKNIGGPEAEKWDVVVGVDEIRTATGANVYRVTEVFADPDWNASVLRLGFGDGALIHLDRAVVGTEPVPMFVGALPVGQSLALVGFGREATNATHTNQLSGFLRAGTNKTIDCSSVPETPTIDPERALCFDTDTKAGPCQRDSGGPAYATVSGKLVVVGITSGSRNSNVSACGQYGVYASLKGEAAFIKSTLPALSGPGSSSGSSGASGSSGDPDTNGGIDPTIGMDPARLEGDGDSRPDTAASKPRSPATAQGVLGCTASGTGTNAWVGLGMLMLALRTGTRRRRFSS
jgi:hypothetical protein